MGLLGLSKCGMLGGKSVGGGHVMLGVLGVLVVQMLVVLSVQGAQVQGAGSAGDAEQVQLLCSDGDAVLRLQWVQVVVSQLSQVVPLLNPVPDLLQPPLEGPDEPPGFCLCEPLLWVLSQEPLEGDSIRDPSASTPWCYLGVLWHPGRCGAMVGVPQAW